MKRDKLQEKIDRLAHIEEIFNNTMGWSRQLFNLYEERQKLKKDIAHAGDRDYYHKKRSNSGHSMGNGQVREDNIPHKPTRKKAVRDARP